MRAIKSKGMKPELAVRQLLHRLGYRFRLHRHDLPGRPDIVLPGRKAIVQVHGCFWHHHRGCRCARIPATRREYWEPKLRGNAARDARHLEALDELGWRVLVVWECEVKAADGLEGRLREFLGPPGRS